MTTLGLNSYLEDLSSSKHNTFSLDQLVDIWFFRVVILSIRGCGPRIPEGSWKPFKRQGLCFLTYLCDFSSCTSTLNLQFEFGSKYENPAVFCYIRH